MEQAKRLLKFARGKELARWCGGIGKLGAALLLSLNASLALAATSIVFIGNSFTAGFPEVHQTFRPDTVTDLNGSRIGGVPAMFKAFTAQAGLDYEVSLETVNGSNLDLHYNTKLPLLSRSWDKVVMSGYSTLDADAPGDPTKIITYSGLLAEAFRAHNPKVEVAIMATWARADQTYLPNGHWYGKPISAMAHDVQAAYEKARASHPALINTVIPVGLAWNRAIDTGIADSNPYDGTLPTQMNLWTVDNYHGNRYGSYLEALVIFGAITGVDPRTLGSAEPVATELLILPSQAYALQSVAWEFASQVLKKKERR